MALRLKARARRKQQARDASGGRHRTPGNVLHLPGRYGGLPLLTGAPEIARRNASSMSRRSIVSQHGS